MPTNSFDHTLAATPEEACAATHLAFIGNVLHVCALPADHDGPHEDNDTTAWA